MNDGNRIAACGKTIEPDMAACGWHRAGYGMGIIDTAGEILGIRRQAKAQLPTGGAQLVDRDVKRRGGRRPRKQAETQQRCAAPTRD